MGGEFMRRVAVYIRGVYSDVLLNVLTVDWRCGLLLRLS